MAVLLSLDLAMLTCIQGISTADLSKQATRAIILVPTRELAEQVSNHLKTLLKYCEGITSVNIAAGATTHLQRCVDIVFEWSGCTSPYYNQTWLCPDFIPMEFETALVSR